MSKIIIEDLTKTNDIDMVRVSKLSATLIEEASLLGIQLQMFNDEVLISLFSLAEQYALTSVALELATKEEIEELKTMGEKLAQDTHDASEKSGKIDEARKLIKDEKNKIKNKIKD
jgi:DNA uptake protein ComE-like DNA-binding protein